MLSQLKPEEHMPHAFRKCGLHPVDVEQVLQRIPHVLATESIAINVDAALLQQLETNRHKWASKLWVPYCNNLDTAYL
jgi:hypothetical protein